MVIDTCSSTIVQDVHRDNLPLLWPKMVDACNRSAFIAMDTEMTGLGSKDGLKAKDMDVRYTVISEAAQSRAIVSLGISMFIEANGPKQYEEPASLEFLTANGFDFNRQIAYGIKYEPGDDKPGANPNEAGPRRLFQLVCSSGKPLVLHNGFIDMIFLYQGLYASLPRSLDTFTADVESLCRGGLIDTKYIADYQSRDKASYLEYLFRKRLRQSCVAKANGRPRFGVTFVGSNEEQLDLDSVQDLAPRERTYLATAHENEMVCQSYAYHGTCDAGASCRQSHDLDLIIAIHEGLVKGKKRKAADITSDHGVIDACQEQACIAQGDAELRTGSSDIRAGAQSVAKKSSRSQKRRSRRKLKAAHTSDGSEATSESHFDQSKAHETPTPALAASGMQQTATIHARYSHRAGFDAFMTGYVYAGYRMEYGDKELQGWANHLPLSYKQYPLKIVRSQFAQLSEAHERKAGIGRAEALVAMSRRKKRQ